MTDFLDKKDFKGGIGFSSDIVENNYNLTAGVPTVDGGDFTFPSITNQSNLTIINDEIQTFTSNLTGAVDNTTMSFSGTISGLSIELQTNTGAVLGTSQTLNGSSGETILTFTPATGNSIQLVTGTIYRYQFKGTGGSVLVTSNINFRANGNLASNLSLDIIFKLSVLIDTTEAQSGLSISNGVLDKVLGIDIKPISTVTKAHLKSLSLPSGTIRMFSDNGVLKEINSDGVIKDIAGASENGAEKVRAIVANNNSVNERVLDSGDDDFDDIVPAPPREAQRIGVVSGTRGIIRYSDVTLALLNKETNVIETTTVTRERDKRYYLDNVLVATLTFIYSVSTLAEDGKAGEIITNSEWS